jgi:hypothetical protein
MIVLVCQGCGQKGEIPEDLAAELDKCPKCGQSLFEAPTGAAVLELPAGGRPFGQSLARRWKRHGMVLGGLAGAAAVLLLATVPGPLAPPLLGAFVGAMAGMFFGAHAASLGGFQPRVLQGDHSWVDIGIIFLMVLGIAGGLYLGAFLEELTSEIVLLAALGGLLVAGWLGALWGERLGRKAEAAQAPPA